MPYNMKELSMIKQTYENDGYSWFHFDDRLDGLDIHVHVFPDEKPYSPDSDTLDMNDRRVKAVVEFGKEVLDGKHKIKEGIISDG